MTDIQNYASEMNTQLADASVKRALLATTFKGLTEESMKKAILEGMMRGFTFKEFLQKDVYAIPFSGGYTLVTSIDYCRKIAMRSGLVGTSAPQYTFTEDGKVMSCSMTVKRKVNDFVGEYTAEVFFDEFNTGKNQWASKPKHMLGKVAEMHALRKAFPEEMAKQYVEEEYQQETAITIDLLTDEVKNEIDTIETIEELQKYYLANKGKGKDFDKYISARKAVLKNTNIVAH